MEADKKWSIFVIDNSDKEIHYLQNLFKNSPYSIITTNDGEKGFNLLLENPDKFSAIILGQNILNIDSLSLLHKINSCSALKTIPVIMEASTGSIEEMEISIRAGARYYLPKHLDRAMMPAVIATAVRDQTRYQEEEHSVWGVKPLNTLINATFKLQNLHEAQAVAALLANECPNPRLAAVGISEILINAIEHGNLGISYLEKTKLHESAKWLAEIDRRLALPENRLKFVTVQFKKTKDCINIRIIDEGKGFDWEKYQKLDTSRVFDNHGRGIIMAKGLSFENIIFHGKGNDVECIIPLSL